MPVINEKDHSEHLCPWNGFRSCFGASCMAWSWHGRYPERRTTDNLVETADGPRPGEHEPPPPDNREAWVKVGTAYLTGYENSNKLNLPKKTAQHWELLEPVTRGHCARAGHGDCGGPL